MLVGNVEAGVENNFIKDVYIMRKIISVILAIVFVCSLAGCATTDSEVEPTEASVETTTSEVVKTKSGFKVDYKESKVVTIDFSDGTKDMLLLFFNCTNESKNTVTPMDKVDIDAFQNGIGLQFCTLYELEEMGDAVPCDTSVQSGASTMVVWFFELRDDSPVSVEVDGENFTLEVK